MDKLEIAARQTLAKLTNSEEILRPLYLQPDRAIFLAEKARIILKVYVQAKTQQQEYRTMQRARATGIPLPEVFLLETGSPAVLAMQQVIGRPLSSEDAAAAKEAGAHLEQFHHLRTFPPFSGGQTKWDAFIVWWADREISCLEALHIFTDGEILQCRNAFEAQRSLFAERPIALLHGDLQAVHILIDPPTQKVVAFLDFADAQSGDPLLDIAVLSLWDNNLADKILEGYTGIANDEQTQLLLSHYRLLRHLAEIPWLLERGFREKAEEDRNAVKALLSRS